MPRGRTRISFENAGGIYSYLQDASADPARWASLIRGEADAARRSLGAIPTVDCCPLPKEADTASPIQVPDIDLLDAWARTHVSDSGWGRILSALRQQRHTRRNELKTIKLSTATHQRLTQVARDILGTDIDNAIDALARFAKQNPEHFSR